MIRALHGPLAGRDGLGGAELEEIYGVDLPAVRANLVVSLDAVVSLDGVSHALGGPADTEVFAALRALSDVVLVGAGTARAEGYGPAWLSGERRQRRAGRGQAPLPAVAVITSGADLDPGARLFAERRDDQPPPPRPLVFTTEAAPAERVAALGSVATVVVAGAEEVDPGAVLAELHRRGHRSVLCEGGPGLLGQLVAAGLVDDLCLTLAPMLAGPGQRVLSGSGDAWPSPHRLRLRHLLEGDGLLMTRYGRAASPRTDG